MLHQSFAFKQFTINQDKCAMKVGTDAVLIGAWTSTENTNTILDIGTGTGIIALMLAQRCDAMIDAIDIDQSSCLQAKENVQASKWRDRIQIHHSSLQEFCNKSRHQYDLIVSNPPYFIDSSKSPAEARTMARHNDQLPFKDVLNGVVTLMAPHGRFCVIFPSKEGVVFREMAREKGLFLNRLLRVKTTADKSEKRLIMEFGFSPTPLQESYIVIEKQERHSYTDEYKELTKDYYLNF